MDVINELVRTKEITLNYFELEEVDLEKKYGKGKWSIRQLLHHIADAEVILHARLKRIIANPDQIIWAFDQDAWCNELKYEEYPLVLSESLYNSARDANIFLVEKFLKSHGSIEFEHSSEGGKSLKDEMEKIAWHNAHHLEHIERALGRYDHFKYN